MLQNNEISYIYQGSQRFWQDWVSTHQGIMDGKRKEKTLLWKTQYEWWISPDGFPKIVATELKLREWAPKNWCFQTVVLEQTLESPLDSKEITPVNPKGIFIGRTDCWSSYTLATWCKEPGLWKRPRCWERLKAKREEDGRGWDSLIASLTQWKWIWVNSWK